MLTPSVPVQIGLPSSTERQHELMAKKGSSAKAGAPKSSAETKSSQSLGDGKWPDSLRDYVGRCFEAALDAGDEGRARVEQRLKERIAASAAANELWSIDWDAEPLVSFDQDAPKTPSSTQGTAKRPGSDDIGLEDAASQLEKRSKRFGSVADPSPSTAATPTPTRQENGALIGQSQVLEKRYLRLTSEPDPSTVRPLPVLRKTMDLLLQKWDESGNYGYMCDQLKSVRQDLTVQRIRNEFTVFVYETHARIALVKGDLGEFNQCQTQLPSLYALDASWGSPREFLAYRMLYALHTRNNTMIGSMLISLTPQDKGDPYVSHALSVRKAVTENDFHQTLCVLYPACPGLGRYLMDCFVDRERVTALCFMAKAFRPSLPLQYVTQELGFSAQTECVEYLDSKKCSVSGGSFMCKESMAVLEQERRKHHRVDIKGQL